MRISYKPHHFKCNICEARCPYDRKMLNKMEGTDKCRKFVSPDQFRVPIIIQMLNKNATVIHNLLTSAGLRFKELDKYPFFRLEVK